MDFIRLFKNLFFKKELLNSWDIDAENEEYDEVKDAHFEEIFGSEEFGNTPSKNWKEWLPIKEIQGGAHCVSFSRNNCAEIMARHEEVVDDDDEEVNFSDLDLAIGSGTTDKGNSLKAVAEYARITGVSLEKECPYTYNKSEWQSRFNDAKNKKKYRLGNWSWVNCNNNSLKSALEKGPIQIAVGVGYNYNNNGIIKDPKSYQCYHAIICYYIDEIGNKYIYDHYDKEFKTLDKNYNIYYAMIFADLPKSWRGMGIDDIKFYNRMIGKLIILPESSGEVFRVEENCLRKVKFVVTDKKLWDILQIAMREKKAFLGVSNKDFERLKKVAFTMEGVVESDKEIDIKSILEIF